MGYSIAWVAVKGLSDAVAAERLGLLPTDEFCDYAKQDLAGLPMPNGWLLLVARGCDHWILDATVLTALSTDCELVACSVEEHVMFSSSESWANGKRIWRVVHDAQESIDHLSSVGELPADFAATRALYAREQEAEGGKEADVDCYFEIPLVLAKDRVGFKHDEGPSADPDAAFRVYKEASSSRTGSKRPWWRFWP
jgi:hypothetical protein